MPENDSARSVERVLFLTGHLAQKSLHRILDDMQPLPFAPEVLDIGINVAGLMTAELIRRRLPAPVAADRINVPGRCRGDMDALSAHYSVPVQRGPEEMKDLPQFFNQQAQPVDLSQPFARLTIREAILQHTEAGDHVDSRSWLINELRKLGMTEEKDKLSARTLASLQVLYFEETVEDKLWQPTFIMEHPTEISPLARAKIGRAHV